MDDSSSRDDVDDTTMGEKRTTGILHTEEHLRAAVHRARAAQPQWHRMGLRARSRVIRATGRRIAERGELLVSAITECTGKPRVDALGTEVLTAAVLCRYYPRLARKCLRPRRIRGSSIIFFNKRSILLREPYGVIGIIAPWNYPFGIPMHEVVQSLLAGNTVILKVATQARAVGDAIAGLFRDSGLPDGALAVVHIPGRIAGSAFVDSGIDKLFFTGSTEVGRQLMALAAGRLLPLSLELGGNDAMIVLRNADLSRAVDGAIWAGLSNSGQSCGAVERIYVEDQVHAAFVELLKRRISLLRQGVELGALTTVAQLRTVRRHVADARKKGAEVWIPEGTMEASAEASERPPFVHPPTVIDNASPEMLVSREETFGPVLGVQEVADEGEAIQAANDGDLGLCASVWTRNARQGRRVAEQLQSGVVMINDHLMSHGMPETPWGGYKQSSLGRCHGDLGFFEVTQSKTVVMDLLHLARNFWWLPYDDRLEDGLRGALDLLFGRGVLRRIRGAGHLIRVFTASFRRRP